MTRKLYAIAPSDIEGLWPFVEPKIADIPERSRHRYSLAGIKTDFKNRQAQLWAVWDPGAKEVVACAGTMVRVYPTGKKIGSIFFVSGKNRNDWAHFVKRLEEWAWEEGCREMEVFARPGWEKTLKEYRRTHVLLEKTLSAPAPKEAKAEDPSPAEAEEPAPKEALTTPEEIEGESDVE